MLFRSIMALVAATPEWTATRESVQVKQSGTHCELMTLEGIKPEPPRYTWEPYIRLDNINVIRGDGGAGKTMLIMAVAAAITTGIQLPDMPGALRCGQGAVIYYGTEDDPGEYAYRAEMCGCDPKHMHIMTESSVLPALSDLSDIRRHIKDTGAKMIVFDPLQSFLGAKTDMNRANEVRPLLDGLRGLCREMECTAVIVEHLNKAAQQKAVYRGIGSVDVTNAARSVILVGYHPERVGERVALQIKANARDGLPIAFSIAGDGAFSWRGTCDVTEEEVANARRVPKPNSEPVIDPVLAMVLKLMELYPNGWTGTANQLIATVGGHMQTPLVTDGVTIGKRLPGLQRELIQRGITWQRKKRDHSFFKSPATLVPFPQQWIGGTDETDE